MHRSIACALSFVALVAVPAFAKKPAPAAEKPKHTQSQVEESIPFELMDFEEAQKTLPAKLGAPKTATTRAQIWYFEPKKDGGNVHCGSIALVRSPYGHALTNENVMNGDPCEVTKLTKKAVTEVLPKESSSMGNRSMESSVAFEEAAKSFEAKLGKPAKTDPMFDEYKMLSWSYTDEEGKCKYLVLLSQGGKGGFQKIWNLDCK